MKCNFATRNLPELQERFKFKDVRDRITTRSDERLEASRYRLEIDDRLRAGARG
jgi:hypothetical protein